MPALGLIGSDGALVTAAMETAGQYAQSVMLDEFNGPLGQKLGGLLYLIAIIGALITISSGGSYRFGLYLLVGPPLFFFLVQNRVASGGVQWQFGDRVLPQTSVQKADNGIVGADGSAGQVSTFFMGWDRIVSGAIQGAVSLLHITANGSDRDFIAKVDRYLMVFSVGTLDRRLHGFMQLGMVGACGEYFNLKRYVSNPYMPPEEVQNQLKKLNNLTGKDKSVTINESSHKEIYDWLQNVLPDAPEIKAKQDKFDCEGLWRLAMKAYVKLQGQNLIDMIVNSNPTPGLTPAQVKARLLTKFATSVGVPGVIKATVSSSPTTNGDTPGISGDDVLLSYLINEIAARAILNELKGINPAIESLSVSHDAQFIESGGRRFDEDTAHTMRILQRGDETQYKGEVIVAGLILPYLQGAVLFFLAASFPFFAITLVIPGRHTAFLLWMGLWFWAKSWDLGVAVVMMIDNMLYALMPHGPPITPALLADSGKTFNALLQVDPTYSAFTYYSILSSCMLAIPFITGLLVHKGGNEVIDAVTASFREFPSKFGHSMSAYGRSYQAQHFLSMQRRLEYAKTSESLWTLGGADGLLRTAAKRSVIANLLVQGSQLARTALALDKNRLTAIMGQTSEDLIKASGEHNSMLFKTRFDLLAQSVGYIASKSHFDYTWSADDQTYVKTRNDLAYEYAALAVSLRFNSHDFRQATPTAAKVDSSSKVPFWFPARGVMDNVGDRVVGK